MNLSFISSSDIFRKSPILPIIQNYAAKIQKIKTPITLDKNVFLHFSSSLP